MTNIPNRNDLIALADLCGEIAQRFFQIDVDAEWKGDDTPITLADQQINDHVVRFYAGNKDLFVIGEEGSGGTKGARYTLMVDPVDGTFPFANGVPTSAIVLCLFDGLVPIVSVIYDFMLDRMWSAERGKGAWMNNQPINVSTNTGEVRPQTCAVWWDGCNYNMHAVISDVMKESSVSNPLSIAYFGGILASGGIDATIFPGTNSWETGAMEVLVTEAGGKCTDILGNPLVYGWDGANIINEGHIMSNGGPIHQILVDAVNANN